MPKWIEDFAKEKIVANLLLWAAVGAIFLVVPALSMFFGYSCSIQKVISISAFYEPKLVVVIPGAFWLLIQLIRNGGTFFERIGVKDPSNDEMRLILHGEAVSQLCGIGSILIASSGLYFIDKFMTGGQIMDGQPESILPGALTGLGLYLVAFFWYWIIFGKKMESH